MTKPIRCKSCDVILTKDEAYYYGDTCNKCEGEQNAALDNEGCEHNIPNCAICRWMLSMPYAIIGSRFICAAQAGKPAESVYNNDECKLLFELKED